MKKTHLWIIAAVVALLGTVFRFMGNFLAGIIAAALFALLVPHEDWQMFIQKYVNGRAKTVLTITLAVIFCISSILGFALFSSVTNNPTTSDADTPITTTSNVHPFTTTNETATTVTTVTTTASRSTTTATTVTTTTLTATTTTRTTTITTVSTTVHIHEYASANCVSPKTCSKCGATEGTALGHSWEDATCTSPKRCSECGETSGSTTSHSYSDGECQVCGSIDPDYTSEKLVWIPTNGGSKYHRRSSCSQMIDPEQVTESEAIALGFERCGRCKP